LRCRSASCSRVVHLSTNGRSPAARARWEPTSFAPLFLQLRRASTSAGGPQGPPERRFIVSWGAFVKVEPPAAAIVPKGRRRQATPCPAGLPPATPVAGTQGTARRCTARSPADKERRACRTECDADHGMGTHRGYWSRGISRCLHRLTDAHTPASCRSRMPPSGKPPMGKVEAHPPSGRSARAILGS
jgi:hypothetical protein